MYIVYYWWWTFYSFTKNKLIGEVGASFHITNNDTSHYDVTNISKLVQGSSDNMSATKKGKLKKKFLWSIVQRLVQFSIP